MLTAALVLAAVAFAPGTDESFESMAALPPDWKLVEFTPGISSAKIKRGDAADGKQYLRLSAPKPNHTRLYLPVDVKPGSTYRFSARVRADGSGPVPAVLTLDGTNITSDSIRGDGKWHASRFYFRSGQANKVTLVLSLGRFGDTVAGDADFDLLKLKRVDSAPPDTLVADATPPTPTPAADNAAAPEPKDRGPNALVYPLIAIMLALLAGVARVFLRGDRDR